MILTEEMIRAAASSKGGWTKRQLEILGVSWPPKRGWLRSVIGRDIETEVYQQFLEAGSD